MKKKLFVVVAEVVDSFCYIMAIKLSDLILAFDKQHVVLIGVKSATSIISFKLKSGVPQKENKVLNLVSVCISD